MTNKLKQAIDKIPDDEGWYKSGSKQRYMDLAKLLLGKGFTEDEVLEMLTEAYWAAAACFGC